MNRFKQAGFTIIELAIVFILTPLIFACVGGWVTHVITCIRDESWLFLIAGAICFPIGVIHGIGIWFGVF